MGAYAIPAPPAPRVAIGAQLRPHRDSGSERSERATRSAAKNREARRQRPQGAPASLLETAGTADILHQAQDIVFTDTGPEHKYRAQVADALEKLGWQTRANSMRLCGRGAIQMDCRTCDAPHLMPFRCGCRTCPTCARNAAAAVVARITAKVAIHDAAMEFVPWDGADDWDNLTYYRRATSKAAPKGWRERRWRVITITRRPEDTADPFALNGLRAQVRAARRLFSQWWRSTPWGRQRRDKDTRKLRSRRDTSYVVGLEVSPNGMVHFHAAIYGEYIQQSVLLAAWRYVLQKAGIAASHKDGGVRVEKVRTMEGVADALREVLKYATKGQNKGGIEQMPAPYRAAAVECAFRNVRRSDVGGALRSITNESICETTPDDLHDAKVAACQACGTVGEWWWRGIRPRSFVERNGGFGLFSIDALGFDWGPQYRGPPDRGHC